MAKCLDSQWIVSPVIISIFSAMGKTEHRQRISTSRCPRQNDDNNKNSNYNDNNNKRQEASSCAVGGLSRLKPDGEEDVQWTGVIVVIVPAVDQCALSAPLHDSGAIVLKRG